MHRKMKTFSILFTIFTFSFAFSVRPSLGETFDCSFAPQIDTQVEEWMNQTYIPSVATAVIKNNSVIWAKGYGEQPKLDTIYMTGSVSKTFTATAVFQLYEQGLIGLNDDVNLYLPYSLSHPNYTDVSITIRMLLTHTSGLSKGVDTWDYGMARDALQRLGWEAPYWLPFPDWIEEHLTVNGSLYEPAVWSPYRPRTTWHYSNVGYEVLGYIVQLISGEHFVDYIQENILNPLEMDSTGYNISNFDTAKLAIPYIYKFELDPESTGNKAYPHYNDLGYASGAIRSNVYDLARFLLVHLHKGVSNGTRILREETIRLMHQLYASWNADIPEWGGWGGTSGDVWGFHTKAYGIYNRNTTVPYAVITFVNQGIARNVCFAITSLLQQYVHQYDGSTCTLTTPNYGFPSFIVFVVVLVFKYYNHFRRKKN